MSDLLAGIEKQVARRFRLSARVRALPMFNKFPSGNRKASVQQPARGDGSPYSQRFSAVLR